MLTGKTTCCLWRKAKDAALVRSIYSVWYAGGVLTHDFQTAARKTYIQKACEIIAIIQSFRSSYDDGWRAVSLLTPLPGCKSEILLHSPDWRKYTYQPVLNYYHPTKDFCVLNQYIFCTLKMIDRFAAASTDHILQLKMKCAFILKPHIFMLVKQVKHTSVSYYSPFLKICGNSQRSKIIFSLQEIQFICKGLHDDFISSFSYIYLSHTYFSRHILSLTT